MLDLFLPNKQIKSIYDINLSRLKERGIKGLVVDLDNTLVAWDQAYATEEILKWFDELRRRDIKFLVFSNNHADRVATFAYPHNLPYLARAKKPLPKAFKQAAKQMELVPQEVAIIGDQLLTDILGGNAAGLYTILVDPLVQSDAPITQFNRKLEGLILEGFYRKGKLVRREIDE